MNKKLKTQIFLLLAAFGIFAIFDTMWAYLEIIFYGEALPNVVDSIIGVIIYYSFYLNLRYWLTKGDI